MISRVRTVLTGSLVLVCLASVSTPLSAQSWRSIGPPGGDVRALAQDPQHPTRLYLGTTDGHIFGSEDAGEHWTLLGRASDRADAVVTSIVVDPRDAQKIFASTWTQDPSAGGGIFESEDGGHIWRIAGLAGQAVRALAQSTSEPDRMVAGTLDGVYGSRNGGSSWQRLSPASNAEIRNLDSVALDPRHPDVLYAGTFHLPWKSADGGKTWASVHAGMIDDSDVMSLLVDHSDSQLLYASACSGIYRSTNGGALWQKINGIPYTSRRTQIILEDPAAPQTIYAGTTEGLWKSSDGGGNWRLMTAPDLVINSMVLPASSPGRIVLGTEMLGVLVSDDGGAHFRPANDGFDHRQIAAVAFDPMHTGRILAVLAHAPEPILMTDNNGENWKPVGPGLTMQQMKRVYSSPDGWWAALQNGGLMHYDDARKTWVRAGALIGEASQLLASPPVPARSRHRVSRVKRPQAPINELSLQVNDMAFGKSRWFAATPHGLLASDDRGAHWSLVPIGLLVDPPVLSVRTSQDARSLWVVSLRGLVFSNDGGRSWTWRDLPLDSGGALRIELTSGKTMLATAGTGLFISHDGGESWDHAAGGLPAVPVEDFAVLGDRIVASLHAGGLYLSTDQGRNWQRVSGTLAQGFFPVVAAESRGDVLAASATDGLYMIDLGGDSSRNDPSAASHIGTVANSDSVPR